MNLLYPELLLLMVPLGFLLWKTTPWRSMRFLWRAAVALLLLLAAAGPHSGGSVEGRDLVLVVDRSRSMPGGVNATVEELVRLAADGAKAGDRISLLTFAADTGLEQVPADAFHFEGFTRNLDLDGSNMSAALEQALAMIPEERPGSILLYSDGEFHGEHPDGIARRAAARGVRIDVRSLARPTRNDVAMERMDLPPRVEEGEPFQFSAWVRAGQATEIQYTLFRGETVISRGTREVRSGLNRLLFRDIGRETGLATYRLQVELQEDPVLANNQGIGVMRVEGNRPLLLINREGSVGRLADALRSAGLDTRVVAARDIPKGRPEWLDSFRGIILEDLPAQELGSLLPDIARQVEDLGTGLMVTGGRSSFGVGGYYRSALDPLLPVTMEIRVEHRKAGLGLAVVLDRSGSMSAGVMGGGTKMDLANAGTMEAIRLLSPVDQVAVIAVDSEPHVIVPMSPVTDPEDFARRVSGIRSMGGGIYTYTGLAAAADELTATTLNNRHIVLFADANDAEEPGRYIELLDKLTTSYNTTVSVVALGKETDADAAFLRDVAKRGGGEIYFSEDPQELPRLFAQDTLLAARSSFIEEGSGSEITLGMLALADLAPGPWANFPGYNLCYLRPGASMGARTTDSYASPIMATMQAGLGRTAAFTGQVSGKFQVSAADWPTVAESLVTMARWISAQAPPQRYYSTVHREGREAVVTIDIDPDAASTAAGGLATHAGDSLTARMVGPGGRVADLPLTRVGPNRLEARVPIGMEGIYRFAAATEEGELLTMDPLAIPYSPEYEPRMEADSGERILGRVARLSGGRMNPAAADLYRGERSGKSWKSMASWFVLAGLMLFLMEIAWRRLWEGQVRRRAKVVAATPVMDRTGAGSAAAMPEAGKVSEPAANKKEKRKRKPKASKKDKSAAKPEPKEPQAPQKDLGDALSGAKRKARRRTDK